MPESDPAIDSREGLFARLRFGSPARQAEFRELGQRTCAASLRSVDIAENQTAFTGRRGPSFRER
ncbi:hypothetical protein [Algihabitans albus]|uniref:hypothetical protein n=1 Tax=Algihabitans albus TaxID=2164067 RepID=UPI001F3B7EE8|nr:hypothetical protein [Algihabitans albus]